MMQSLELQVEEFPSMSSRAHFMKKHLKNLGLVTFGVLLGFFGCILLVHHTNVITVEWKNLYDHPITSRVGIRNAKTDLYAFHLIERNKLEELKKALDESLKDNLEMAWDLNRWDGKPLRKEYVEIAKLTNYYYISIGKPPLDGRVMVGVPASNESEYEYFLENPFRNE